MNSPCVITSSVASRRKVQIMQATRIGYTPARHHTLQLWGACHTCLFDYCRDTGIAETQGHMLPALSPSEQEVSLEQLSQPAFAVKEGSLATQDRAQLPSDVLAHTLPDHCQTCQPGKQSTALSAMQFTLSFEGHAAAGLRVNDILTLQLHANDAYFSNFTLPSPISSPA